MEGKPLSDRADDHLRALDEELARLRELNAALDRRLEERRQAQEDDSGTEAAGEEQ